MKSEQNELLTRIGPGTPCGAVLRQYWQPVALVDEFDPRLDPRLTERAVKAVRILGQDLVLFKDGVGRWGLLDRDCPHRGGGANTNQARKAKAVGNGQRSASRSPSAEAPASSSSASIA